MKDEFDELSQTNIEYLINEWIHNERNRKILYRKLVDGISHERVAEEFELSVSQTKTIISDAKQKMLKHI